MIPTFRYMKNGYILLNELKNSIPIDKRIEMKKLKADEIGSFAMENEEEIFKFLASTPKQRASKKKWQKDFDLFTLTAFLTLYKTLNYIVNVQCPFQNNAQNSYRKDIGLLSRLLHQMLDEDKKLPYLFHDEEDYIVYPDFYYDNYC